MCVCVSRFRERASLVGHVGGGVGECVMFVVQGCWNWRNVEWKERRQVEVVGYSVSRYIVRYVCIYIPI